MKRKGVVFTFQTAGRCNENVDANTIDLVVLTFQTAGRCNVPNLTV